MLFNAPQRYDGLAILDDLSIGNRVNASAFRDLWARVMF